jgi:hypothetical protein
MSTATRFALIGLLGTLGCSAGAPTAPNATPRPAPAPSAPSVYVFVGAEAAPRSGLTFAVRERELFVQLRDQKDGADASRNHYLVKNVPPDFAEKIRSWRGRTQTALRMEPGGAIKRNGPTAVTLHWVSYDRARGHGWSHFILDDEVRDLWTRVLELAVREENAVSEPPDWVQGDERVRDDFHGPKGEQAGGAR